MHIQLWEIKETMQTEQLTELESSLDTMLANYTKEEKEIKEAEATYRWQDGTYEK